MSYDPNEMMLDLFRAEVESHSESLTHALLKLEQDPTDTAPLDGMMRAAHSIKGAARIVRVDAAVDVAHVMEDCFVAAQRGELVLQPAGIDILLRSVDLLGQISDASKNPKVDWSAFQPAVTSTVGELRRVLQGQLLVADELPSPPLSSEAATPTAFQSSEVETLQIENQSGASSAGMDESLVEQSVNCVAIPEVLNKDNAEATRTQLLSALECQCNHQPVIIDLSLTQDLDSVGLALLHSVTRYAAMKKCSLRFENACPILSRVFKAAGIGSITIATESGTRGI